MQRNWLVAGRMPDVEKFLSASEDRLQDYDQFVQLEESLDSHEILEDTQDFSIIQHGYLGIGLNFLVSTKGSAVG